MKFDVNETPAYTLLKTEEINELHSVGLLLEHNKTKAKIAVMLNDDNNKVFSVGFRTPVDNDTGVPHIVEHTVLCGSKNIH
jgi:presequence protease